MAGCAEESPFDFGQPRDCSIPEQNAFMLRLMEGAYLWNEHVPGDVDPAVYESPSDLVRDVRYAELDRWSRVSDLRTTEALYEEGMVIGLGFRTRRDAENRVRLSFVDPLSPAGQAGLRRGDTINGVAGFSAAQLDEREGWGDAFGANEPGVTVQLQVDQGQETEVLSITKDWYPLVTVPLSDIIDHNGTPVGYVFFTGFVEPSIEELSAVFEQFEAADVRHVVVDLRYNGGGRISAARHLVNLLVGAQAAGEVSFRTRYAASLADANSTRNIERVRGSLPSLEHAVFITTGSTASASELVINAVRPWATVSLVGGTTAGKPVGSAQWTFCDKSAHPITFKLLNARDEGDYFDGFAPTCQADDDLGEALGSPDEASMAAALRRLDGDACLEPTPPNDDDEGEGEGEAQVEARGLRRNAPALPGAHPELDGLRGLY